MFYKAFNVDGTINITELDGGLMSTVEVPTRIRAVLINTSATEGNIIEGWIGTKRVLEIYDYNLDTQEESAADTPPFSSQKIGRLPVEIDVPAGQSFKIGVNCGGVASNLFGAYEYDELGS